MRLVDVANVQLKEHWSLLLIVEKKAHGRKEKQKQNKINAKILVSKSVIVAQSVPCLVSPDITYALWYVVSLFKDSVHGKIHTIPLPVLMNC